MKRSFCNVLVCSSCAKCGATGEDQERLAADKDAESNAKAEAVSELL